MRCLIVDDEPLPAKYLEKLINKFCFEITDINILHSPLEAVENLKYNNYDIIFLDVEMPGINGFELLEKVELPDFSHVIFTTAYSQYAVKAFEVNAIHYIMKSVTKQELIKAVRKVGESIKKNEAYKSKHTEDVKVLSIFVNNEYRLIKVKDILYLKGDSGYTNIHLKNEVYLSSKRIGHYENTLSSQEFYRCHNSHIVNLSKILRISKGKGGYLIMEDESVIPYSASKKSFFDKKFSVS